MGITSPWELGDIPRMLSECLTNGVKTRINVLLVKTDAYHRPKKHLDPDQSPNPILLDFLSFHLPLHFLLNLSLIKIPTSVPYHRSES